MRSVSDIIKKLGGSTALAGALGLKSPTTVASWKDRQSIPPNYWAPVARLAAENDLMSEADLLALLARLAASPPTAPDAPDGPEQERIAS
jgi:hypothetical protein